MFLMPPIRSSTSKRRTRIVSTILSLSEVMSPCSRYVKKKLVYVVIALPSGRQPSSYAEYTRANMRSSYDIRSISDNKCIRLSRL